MTDKKKPKRQTGTPRESKEPRRSSAAQDAGKGNALVEATHQVVEDEIRKGDAPAAPGPNQKGEPGSRV